jgi:hypothetical protein
LARFYIDFEFMRYGFSSFYLEFAKGLWFLFGFYGYLGASFELVFLSLEAIFYLATYFMVYNAFLLLLTSAVFLFLSS